MTKWEYKTVENHTPVSLPGTSAYQMLKESGLDGWELVIIHWREGLYIFKRPIDSKDKDTFTKGIEHTMEAGFSKMSE